MAPKIVHVVHNHPLSMVHCYSQGIAFGDIKGVVSIQQGFYYLKLLHHGQEFAAKQLLGDVVRCWSPGLIPQVYDKFLKDPNVNFVEKSKEVMRAIVLHQIEDTESGFAKSIKAELKKLEVDNASDVEFRVYSTGAVKDIIWSSGLTINNTWMAPPPGHNIYADILREVTQRILGEIPMSNPLIVELFSNLRLFMPIVNRSLLVLMDSQARYLNKIGYDGEVIPLSGGKYGDVVRAVKAGTFKLADFKWIVVYCGTNCTKRSYADGERECEWQELKKILIDEANLRDRRSVLFCCAFDQPSFPFNRNHARYVEQQLQGSRVHCINWERIGNPFLMPNKRINNDLFVHENGKCCIHVNQKGFRLIWNVWCENLKGLEMVPYTMSNEPRSVRPSMFEPPPHLPKEDQGNPQSSRAVSRVVFSGTHGRDIALCYQNKRSMNDREKKIKQLRCDEFKRSYESNRKRNEISGETSDCFNKKKYNDDTYNHFSKRYREYKPNKGNIDGYHRRF